MTNGYTESMNAIIRDVDRQGRGYSFDVMRARMLCDMEVRSKKTSTRGRRPQPKPIDDGVYGLITLDDVDDLGWDLMRSERTVKYGADLGKLAAMLARRPFANRNDEST